MSDHLTVRKTGRGFSTLPAIPGYWLSEVSVRESSNAEESCIWLTAVSPVDVNAAAIAEMTDGDTSKLSFNEANLQMTVEAARQLAEQLLYLVENHYHND